MSKAREIAAVSEMIQAELATVAAVVKGTVFGFPYDAVPDGYLYCDGSSLDTTTYAELFTAIGYMYGGSASNFSLPDFRGEFLRGHAGGSSNDPDAATRTDRGDGTAGDVVGSKQTDENKSHVHNHQIGFGGGGTTSRHSGQAASVNQGTINTGSGGGNESRPRNVAVKYCIKY